MENQSRLLLIDGHGMAYRAFYAIRSLTTSAGQPTNALYGFIRMTQQLARYWVPTHAAAVFDGGVPEERLALLATYKAQREPMPDALHDQFPLIEEFLRYTGTPAVREDRQEADDVMATLADRARAKRAEVLLATSDKDLFQCVEGRVSIIPPTKSEVRMDADAVREKTGVDPGQIAEWLALIGDSADNIPGVPGVGAKTAARLLNEFGSVAALYERIDEVPNKKLREALQAHRESVLRNVKMTRLRRELPLQVEWQEWKTRTPDIERLRDFYRRMEFNSMANELESPTLFGD